MFSFMQIFMDYCLLNLWSNIISCFSIQERGNIGWYFQKLILRILCLDSYETNSQCFRFEFAFFSVFDDQDDVVCVRVRRNDENSQTKFFVSFEMEEKKWAFVYILFIFHVFILFSFRSSDISFLYFVFYLFRVYRMTKSRLENRICDARFASHEL